MASRSNPPVSSRRTRDAARRSPDRNSSRSRRSVATRSLILSDRHGDKAARPMRRSTPGRAGSARSLSRDITGLLDFGDQRIPVLRNAVDFARAPIRLAPDERRRSMQTDLLGNPIVLLEERQGALGTSQAKVLVIP